jgi:hypothetical protein
VKLTGEDRIRLHAERDALIDQAIFLLNHDRHWRPALDCLRQAEEITQEIDASLARRFRVEVIEDDSGTWHGSVMRFDTYEEAERYAKDLTWRWTLVRDWRVVAAED